MKILWLVPKWTLPAIDGARVATDSLIRNTQLAGASIDVLCLPNSDEKIDIPYMQAAWKVGNVKVIRRSIPESGFGKKLFFAKKLLTHPLIPLTFASFVEKEIQSEVLKTINEGDYDIVLLDGLHLGAPLFLDETLVTSKAKIVYRAHNLEVDLWKRSFEEKKNPIIKLILYFQSKLIERFENKIITKCSGVAAISQEDLDELVKIKKDSVTLVPLGLNFSHSLPQCLDEATKFLFIGRLDWPPNKDGLEWLLKEVWPSVLIKRPNAVLKIVGSGNRDWLKAYEGTKGLEIVGFVKSLMDAYRDCHFTLVPIFYGSGTRIKVLEAFSIGRRLISTQMGVQGASLTNDDFIGAETKDQWIEVLSTAMLNSEEQYKLEKSVAGVSKIFGDKEIGSRFYSWLKELK